jgi:hypothetical protein
MTAYAATSRFPLFSEQSAGLGRAAIENGRATSRHK